MTTTPWGYIPYPTNITQQNNATPIEDIITPPIDPARYETTPLGSGSTSTYTYNAKLIADSLTITELIEELQRRETKRTGDLLTLRDGIEALLDANGIEPFHTWLSYGEPVNRPYTADDLITELECLIENLKEQPDHAHSNADSNAD